MNISESKAKGFENYMLQKEAVLELVKLSKDTRVDKILKILAHCECKMECMSYNKCEDATVALEQMFEAKGHRNDKIDMLLKSSNAVKAAELYFTYRYLSKEQQALEYVIKYGNKQISPVNENHHAYVIDEMTSLAADDVINALFENAAYRDFLKGCINVLGKEPGYEDGINILNDKMLIEENRVKKAITTNEKNYAYNLYRSHSEMMKTKNICKHINGQHDYQKTLGLYRQTSK